MHEYVMPKNEYDCYDQLKHWGDVAGIEVIRIENVGRPLPDMVWLFKGITMWQEAKILRSNKIQIRVNAHANMMRMRHMLKDWMLTYIVWDEDTACYFVYDFDVCAKITIETILSKPGVGWLNLLGIKYRYKFTSKEEFSYYIEYVLDLAYPNRVRNREKLKQQAEESINAIRFE
jgi:hypothetical protein